MIRTSGLESERRGQFDFRRGTYSCVILFLSLADSFCISLTLIPFSLSHSLSIARSLSLSVSLSLSLCLSVGGGVLLVEALLFENHRGPIMAQIFSLNMLVQTEGKEHPPSRYTHMLTAAGFSDVQVCRTGKSYDAILALK